VEALRNYLKEMPNLTNQVLERLGEVMEEGTFDYNNAEEMRLAFKEAQQVALERIVDHKVPYFVTVYNQVLSKCPHCREELHGAYYEISNPITMVRGMFRLRLMHDFLEHGFANYTEPIVNMSDTLMGEDDHHLDAKKMLKILEGLPVPEAARAELQASAAAAAGKVAV
jgi:hypothetical protein